MGAITSPIAATAAAAITAPPTTITTTAAAAAAVTAAAAAAANAAAVTAAADAAGAATVTIAIEMSHGEGVARRGALRTRGVCQGGDHGCQLSHGATVFGHTADTTKRYVCKCGGCPTIVCTITTTGRGTDCEASLRTTGYAGSTDAQRLQACAPECGHARLEGG